MYFSFTTENCGYAAADDDDNDDTISGCCLIAVFPNYPRPGCNVDHTARIRALKEYANCTEQR